MSVSDAIRFANASNVVGCLDLMAGAAKPSPVGRHAFPAKLYRENVIRIAFTNLEAHSAKFAASVCSKGYLGALLSGEVMSAGHSDNSSTDFTAPHSEHFIKTTRPHGLFDDGPSKTFSLSVSRHLQPKPKILHHNHLITLLSPHSSAPRQG